MRRRVRIQHFRAAGADIEPERLAARLEGVDCLGDGPHRASEELLLRLAADLRDVGGDAPELTDPAAMRRVVLARVVANRARARRRSLALSFAPAVVVLAVAATVTAPQWGPTVGSVLAPLVDGLWGELEPDDVMPYPSAPAPPDDDPSFDAGEAPSFVPIATPGQPSVQPSPEPGGPGAPPSLLPPEPPEATPTVGPITPPGSPPVPSPPVGTRPIPTHPIDPPIPSPSQPPLPRAPGG